MFVTVPCFADRALFLLVGVHPCTHLRSQSVVMTKTTGGRDFNSSTELLGLRSVLGRDA